MWAAEQDSPDVQQQREQWRLRIANVDPSRFVFIDESGACVRHEHVLVPILRPGHIVVLDDLSSHKGDEIRRMVDAVGCELWSLPPYSPDVNALAKMWSKVGEGTSVIGQGDISGRYGLVCVLWVCSG